MLNKALKFSKRIYRHWRETYLKIHFVNFLRTGSRVYSEDLFQAEADTEIDIVTIAFNNVDFLNYQIALLRKNISDKFTHIVADNSSDPNLRSLIVELCHRNGVKYIEIPRNKFTRNKSHAAAMHWTYKNVLRKRSRPFFGFIDHDIFPMTRCSIVSKISNGIYGRVTPAYGANHRSIPRTEATPYWSLWAGFYFFKSELLSGINVYRINFFPRYFGKGNYLDTAGGLWDTVIKNISYPGEMAKYRQVKFRQSEDSNVKTDYYECLDEWIHLVNLSNWYNTPNFKQKLDYMENLLICSINAE